MLAHFSHHPHNHDCHSDGENVFADCHAPPGIGRTLQELITVETGSFQMPGLRRVLRVNPQRGAVPKYWGKADRSQYQRKRRNHDGLLRKLPNVHSMPKKLRRLHESIVKVSQSALAVCRLRVRCVLKLSEISRDRGGDSRERVAVAFVWSPAYYPGRFRTRSANCRH